MTLTLPRETLSLSSRHQRYARVRQPPLLLLLPNPRTRFSFVSVFVFVFFFLIISIPSCPRPSFDSLGVSRSNEIGARKPMRGAARPLRVGVKGQRKVSIISLLGGFSASLWSRVLRTAKTGAISFSLRFLSAAAWLRKAQATKIQF